MKSILYFHFVSNTTNTNTNTTVLGLKVNETKTN